MPMPQQQNRFQDAMRTARSDARASLAQADAKVKDGDVHGAQARVVQAQQALCRFFEESVAAPKTETGYVR